VLDAIEKLTEAKRCNKLKGYILDLRNNPGGLLDQADRPGLGRLPRSSGEIVSVKAAATRDDVPALERQARRS
jgi:carboxyl-terminal processing protease